MTIVTACFNMKEEYGHLYKLFEYSIKKQMPDAEIVCITDPQQVSGKNIVDASLSMKLKAWNHAVQTIDGDIILADCDMIFLEDISSVFDNDFDVAYTKRKHRCVPINSGIVFVKNSDKVRAFFKLWLDINMEMYHNPELLGQYRKKCSGMNQPALVKAIEDAKDINFLPLSCLEYNACESEWANIDETTKVLHLKESLREIIKGQGNPNNIDYKKAIELYNNIVAEAKEAGAITDLDIIKATIFKQEIPMIKVRFLSNGYTTEMTEEMAKRYLAKNKIEYVEVKKEEPKKEQGKAEANPETKAEIYNYLKAKGIDLKNIQFYKLDELKEMMGSV